MSKPQLLDDEIGRKLAQAHRDGELQGLKDYGKPFELDPGWEQTPQEFRMPFKILKDAGMAPPEIELFHERARLRQALQAARDEEERRHLQLALATLEQKLSLRLEALRASGSL